MTVTKPEMYHIEHYLKDARTLPKEALAIVSDTDMLGYEKEFAVYQTQQQEAVRQTSTLCGELRERTYAIFGKNSKQSKYFERAIHGGDALTDQHDQLFPRPNAVRDMVETAKLRCPNINTTNSGAVGRSEESIEEMNSAVAYLLGEGLALNSDFTVGNAVEVAKSHTTNTFHHQMISNLGKGWIDGNNRIAVNNFHEFNGTKCNDEDCDTVGYNASRNTYSCYCGDNDYKGCVGVDSEGEWGFVVSDA